MCFVRASSCLFAPLVPRGVGSRSGLRQPWGGPPPLSGFRRGSRGDWPVSYDTERYKWRNVIERAFNAIKRWRGLAIQYDKHALDYHGGVVLAAIITW